MTTAHSDADRTAFGVLGAISFCHLLNDMMQSLLPAIYPMLKSRLRPELRADRPDHAHLPADRLAAAAAGRALHRPPAEAATRCRCGMFFTLVGLLVLSLAPSFRLLVAAALLGIGSSIFHPESSRVARMASGGRHGLAQSLFQVGGNVGRARPAARGLRRAAAGQSSIAWFALAALLAIDLLWKSARWYKRPRTGAADNGGAAAAVPTLCRARRVARRARGAARADVLQVCLSGEPDQLLHLLPDRITSAVGAGRRSSICSCSSPRSRSAPCSAARSATASAASA